MKFDNYSKGPWTECNDQVLDGDGFAILRTTENLLDKTQHRANVQRIVACVNACEGISTENLTDNVPLNQGLRGLNKRIRDAETQRDIYRSQVEELREECRKIAPLEAQRDELLAALELAVEQMESDTVQIESEWGCGRGIDELEGVGELPEAILKARAVIARIKGGKS